MMIVDAHLDLAFNATPERGRDPRMPASQQPACGDEIATVGLPDLAAGNIGLICATIFCWPADGEGPNGYRNSEEARQRALSELEWYQRCVDENLLRLVRTSADLPVRSAKPQAAILLLEGADAIRTPADVREWFDAGVRIVGLAWHRTRYAGGTGAPGPLTDEGKTLVKEFDRFGIIHDASHLAEQSLRDLLELSDGPIIASHSNCRAIVGEGDRHLSDEMISAIAQRGGVIGINFYEKFLLPKNQHGKHRATLADVVDHVRHICDLAGDAAHVGIGTDMDGGLGREQIPVEIKTSADLPKMAHALSLSGFGDSDVKGIMGENWLRFFREHLPK
jgi:membrane dipeptidase